MSARRIGILGGTFDPIHVGHIDVGLAAAGALGLNRLFLITANVPPHRPQPHASSWHRFAMASMAIAGNVLNEWRASDLELRTGDRSFTTRTLQQFHERGYSPSELFFIIGADAFLEISAWRDYPGILDGAHFAVVSRPGIPADGLRERLPSLADRMAPPPVGGAALTDPLIWLITASTSDVSSSAIRDRRAGGLPITGLVHPAVEQHIEQHGLYTSMVPDRRTRGAPSSPPSPAAGRLHGQS